MIKLETVKRLQEAGWEFPKENGWVMMDGVDDNGNPKYIASPSTDELLEALPNEIDGKMLSIFRHNEPSGVRWRVEYERGSEYLMVGSVDDTLPEALAEMWIKLKENKLL